MNALRRITSSKKSRLLTAADILNGFNGISEYLAVTYPTQKFSVICSGGGCSVLYLRSRKTTHDVDVYSDNADTLRKVLEAGRDFYRRQGPDWGPPDWINAEMVAYVLNNEGCEKLVENSIRQGAVIYESPCLRVYAADWKFQVVGKISRAYDIVNLDKLSAEKDISDFVHILRILSGSQLKRSDMRRWYYYGYRMGKKEVAFANAAYAKAYGRTVIVDDI